MYFTIQKSSQNRLGSGHTSIEKAKVALQKTSNLSVNEKLFKEKWGDLLNANYFSKNNEIQHLIDTFLASSCQLNIEYMNYESCLLAILKDEAYFEVKTLGSDKQADKETYQNMAAISAKNTEEQCKQIAAATRLTAAEFDLLKEKDANPKATWDNLALTSICLRYFVGENESVHWKMVDLDRRGFYSKAILAFHFLNRDKAIDYDTAKIAAIINNGVAVPFDVQKATLQKKIDLLHKLKIDQFLETGKKWDNVSIGYWFENILKPLKDEVKDILHLSITDKSYPIATLQDLLRKMGTELKCTRKKGKPRIYHWEGWLSDPINVPDFFERYAANHALPAEPATPEVQPAAATPEVQPAAATPELLPAAVNHEVTPAAVNHEVLPAAVKPEVTPAAVKPEVTPAAVKPEVTPAAANHEILLALSNKMNWKRKDLDIFLDLYFSVTLENLGEKLNEAVETLQGFVDRITPKPALLIG